MPGSARDPGPAQDTGNTGQFNILEMTSKREGLGWNLGGIYAKVMK